jgi:hypothetical protein
MIPPPDLRPLSPAIVIDAAFPGGNILVERVDGDTLYLKQDLRDTEGWWFHWAFRLRGAAGRTIKVQFEDGNPVGTRGPSPHFVADTLTTSRTGRAVEMARVGRVASSPQHRVFVSARHHACESMASYVLEGLVEGVLAEGDEGPWLRGHVAFLIVPFVDKDGVEDGDQGKNRRPHDHNRDYGSESMYPETAAIRERMPRWSEGKLMAAIDLHCPYIRGDYNEFVYQVGKSEPPIWAEQRRFGAILERVQSGALDYRNADNLAFGQAWNTGVAPGFKSCSSWFGEQPGIRLATSIETAYATAHERVVTAETARAFGRDLARALAVYLREEGRAQ